MFDNGKVSKLVITGSSIEVVCAGVGERISCVGIEGTHFEHFTYSLNVCSVLVTFNLTNCLQRQMTLALLCMLLSDQASNGS